MSTNMNGPVGWFPDPSGGNGQRYFDGAQWGQVAPAPQPNPAAPPVAVAIANDNGGGGMHAVHLLMTILTCGLWLPIWIIGVILEGNSSGHTAVVVGGAPITPPPAIRPQATETREVTGVAKVLAYIMVGILGVFLAMFTMAGVATSPVILLVIVPAMVGGGWLFWKNREKERRVRERELDEAVIRRAEHEHSLTMQGDPRGAFGNYPPAV